jgi:membrane protease YdiL (CAAX protease family)
VRTLALLGLVVALLAVTTLASPPIALGLGALGWHPKFSRVYNRVFEVLLVVGIVAAWRRLDLGNATAWGLRHARWRRDLALGLAVGLAGIGAALVLAWAAGGLVPKLRFPPEKTLWKAGLGIVGAVLIGVGEETLFRGILLRRLRLDCGRVGGLLLTTALYAGVHALRGGARIAVVGAWSGWERTASLFAPLADPVVWPGVAGLFALGLVLAWTRLATGSLWIAIGIHAGWVGVFRVGRLFFDIRRRPEWVVGPGWPPLVGGAAGALAVAVTAVLLVRALRRRRGR